MRITQVMMTKGFGGAERSFVDTVLALAERGHQVQAICQPNFVKRHLLEDNANIQLNCVKQSGWWDELAASRIRRAVVDFAPSVVHAHLARGSWLAGRALRSLDIPLVCKLHNYANLAYYKYVDHFIGTTVDQRRYLQENNISDDRINVIPNFSRLKPTLKAPEALECSESTPCTFITCGRLNQVKGFDILLRAFHLALEHNKNLRLIIGGEGEEKPLLQRMITDLGLQDTVELAGWIDDVPGFLDRGDVYVVSSRSESFGIALLEAMSRGLPVITTRTKGPSQILDESNAWFADVEDEVSLQKAITNSVSRCDLRDHRGSEMLEIYKSRYFEDAVLGHIEELYRSLDVLPSQSAIYESYDNGRMLVSKQKLDVLGQMGITSAVDALELPLAQILRDVDGRQTGTLVGADTPTTKQSQVYLKRHLKSQNTSKDFCNGAEIEFDAIQECERAGVPTLKAIAYGKNEDAATGTIGSFLLTEEAGGGVSAEQISHAWRMDPSNRQQTVAMRHDLISSIALTTRRLHAAHLYHQDLYWTHFFPVQADDGQVQAHLIDVQRLVKRKSYVSKSVMRLKDLAQMRFSMEWVGLNSEEVNFFYNRYFYTSSISVWHRLFVSVITTLIWARTFGRLTKLAARRKNRTTEETIKIELQPISKTLDIPVIPSNVNMATRKAG